MEEEEINKRSSVNMVGMFLFCWLLANLCPFVTPAYFCFFIKDRGEVLSSVCFGSFNLPRNPAIGSVIKCSLCTIDRTYTHMYY